MNVLRRCSNRALAALIAAVVAAVAVSATVAMSAFAGSGSVPPAESLPQAIHDAASAPAPAGVTARITFTNHLLPAGALGQVAGLSGSPLLTGASGRLWLTGDGHLRLELQSDAGDVQIVSDGTTLTVYDGTSNTAYELTLPAGASPPATPSTPPSIDQIQQALTRLAGFVTLSAPEPGSIAGRPAYTVTITPKGSGGLVGGASAAWDAATGVPLQVAVYARGDASPVLELAVTDISYGAVPASDVEIAPPAGAKVVQLSLPSTGAGTGSSASGETTGLAAVAAAVPFKLVAPDTLDGLARSQVRLTGSGADAGALVTYGEGLGTLVVAEHAATGTSSPGILDRLPTVSLGAATGHELVTALGTVVRFDASGVSFAVGGSVTQADAEAAARALAS